MKKKCHWIILTCIILNYYATTYTTANIESAKPTTNGLIVSLESNFSLEDLNLENLGYSIEERGVQTIARTTSQFEALNLYALPIENTSETNNLREHIEEYIDEGVVFVDYNKLYSLAPLENPETPPNDTYYDYLWGWQLIGMDEIYNTETGDNTIIGIVDSGIDYEHEDLANNMWINEPENINNIAGCQQWPNSEQQSGIWGDEDGLDNDNNGYIDDCIGWHFVQKNNNPMDTFGHGTHVAGITAAIGNNNKGIIGVAHQANIMALNVHLGGGGISLGAALNAFDYALNKSVSVLNMSWGGNDPCTRTEQEAFNILHDANIILVSSAGNDNSSDPYYSPSSCFHVMSVAASNENNEREVNSTWGSNYGATVDITGPGKGILSTIPNDNYMFASGTSMASPHVAGAAAIIKNIMPTSNSDDVNNALRCSATDLTTYGFSRSDGGLLINVPLTLSNLTNGSITENLIVENEMIINNSYPCILNRTAISDQGKLIIEEQSTLKTSDLILNGNLTLTGNSTVITNTATGTGTLQINDGTLSVMNFAINENTLFDDFEIGSNNTILSNKLYLGITENAHLNILDGGSLKSNNSYIGKEAGSNGVLNINASTWENTHTIQVGISGNATLSITNGSIVSTNIGYIAYNNTSSGQVTVKGPGSSWIIGPYFYVGSKGDGALLIEDGGNVIVSGNSYTGRYNGSGTITISGNNAKWTTAKSLFMSASSTSSEGTSTINIKKDGILEVYDSIMIGEGNTFLLDEGLVLGDENRVTVNGNLGGTGTLKNVIYQNGTLSVGKEPTTGNIILKNFLFDTGTTVNMTIENLYSFDTLSASGDLTLNGALVIDLLSIPSENNQYQLFNWTNTNLTGTFSNHIFPDLSDWNLAWNSDTLYTDGMLKVTSTSTPVPEPTSTTALIIGTLILGYALSQKKQL